VTEYLLSQRGAPELERLRLQMLQEFHDPLSVRQLDTIGVGEGWRCLDAGAGAGSVTQMLSARVGPTGSVLAIDLETSLLEEIASDRVEVRCHDLLRDPLPADSFDLVHARLLLMHLPARREALRRLVAAARPGGWVAAVDPDFTTVELAPANLAWEATWSVFLDALVAGGWDPRYGRRLGGDLRAAGLVEVEARHVASSGPGGTLPLRLLSLTIERLRERMVALGAGCDEIDEARRMLEDPANTISSQTTHVAHGRRAGLSPDRHPPQHARRGGD
jgi:SAM-dependent methyltransferase